MKKIKAFLFMFLLGLGTLLAQTPGAFNYQAVLRDAEGKIISNQDVGIQISILQQSASGELVFQEKHSASTNEFGLIVLEIGNGIPITGTLAEINWGASTHFLKVELDATGGESYTDMGTSQMLSVPYALYAKSSGSSFSGKYADLEGTPELPNDISDLSDVGKLLFDGDYNSLANKPDLSQLSTENTDGWDKDVSDDFDGDYNSLTNKPDFSPYVKTANTVSWDKNAADDFDGDYNNLTNKPTTISAAQVTAIATNTAKISNVKADWNAATGEAQILNKPDLTVYVDEANTTNWDKDVSDDFSGSFNDLTDVPVNLDTDATDDFDGDYNSLINKPTTISAEQVTAIAANTAKVSNVKADWNAATGEAQILNKPDLSVYVEEANTSGWDKNASDDFSGSFNDLTDLPTNLDTDASDDFDGDYNNLINKPTTISAAQASAIDANTAKISNVKADWNAATGDAQILNKPDLTVYVEEANTSDWDKNASDDFDGDYNSLINKPTTISTAQATAIDANTAKVSNVKADWNAATGEAQILNKPDLTVYVEAANTSDWDKNASDDFNGDYNSLTNQPDLSDIHSHDGSADYTFIGTANDNTVTQNTATGKYATVTGGENNSASGLKSTIAGGKDNIASGARSTVSGGSSNKATEPQATVGGGEVNTASGNTSTVSGGALNTASSYYTTVGGGFDNMASGHYSTIPGGVENQTFGEFSTAMGYRNYAKSYGETALGYFSTDYTALSTSVANPNDRLFVIGNGTGTSARSNALVMLKNGNTTLNGDLTVNGTIKSNILSTSTDYTITDTDGYSIILSNGANIVLPDPSSNVNRVITIKNKSDVAGTGLTVQTSTGTIDGRSNLDLAQYSSAKLVSDGSNWWIIENYASLLIP